jgi:micrococcal nuclease
MIKFILLMLLSVNAYAFDVVVRYVHDGDTIAVKTDLLPMPLSNMAIRLHGIDTPELRGKCQAEKAKAKLAKDYLKSYIKPGDLLRVDPIKWDKYGGRFDAHVYHQGVDLSDVMIAAGYAVKYNGTGGKKDWCAP